MKESFKQMLEQETKQLPKTVASSFKTPKKKNKNKMISAYVDIQNYNLFTEINYELGVSNNSVLNKLIENYIKKNKKIL